MIDKIDYTVDIIHNQLDTQERKILIIKLMRADNYTVSDVYNVIDDVLYYRDWKALANLLQPED